MKTIGIRELRQHASRYLRLVEAGERVEVTDRGRPVALLVPIVDKAPIEKLIGDGRASVVELDLLDLGDPLQGRDGVPLPSEVIVSTRADER
ncbi:MAG: type II toxin-antitoxin system prevent-host-death family antitoxin [Actinobacteria bacterium]|nr:type II toxin-antitoxin system prevent-host-death family antitoxin [Actinomycetota bacterium]